MPYLKGLKIYIINPFCTFKTAHKIPSIPSSLFLFSLPAFSWSSPRPISTSQLHTLLYFHLWPIYLVVFKGSYFLSEWDISS